MAVNFDIIEEPKPSPAPRNPVTKFAANTPHVTTGPVCKDSQGYSLLRAAGYCQGVLRPELCKEEIETDRKMKAMGYGQNSKFMAKSFLVPASTRHITTKHPDGTDDGDAVKFVSDLRQKMAASYRGGDPDEEQYIAERTGLVNKAAWSPALGTTSDTAGGSLLGFPTLGELIDIQRNLEAFAGAGATEITLPPNGRISFPKLTNGATAYNVGEGAVISQSQEATGSLLLEAKKIGVLVPFNNEMMRYIGATAENMIRNDMARVGAIKADLDMLQGTGGTQMLGLINYPTQTTWTFGVDKLIAHTSVGTPVDGNSGYPFQPEDINLMLGKLPDAVDGVTAWIVRKAWYAYLLNRRADAVTAADGKGQFVFDVWRSMSDRSKTDINGSRVIRTSQVLANRTRGSGSTFTYVIAGNMPDWIIARHGVMEFMANPYGDQAFQYDQTVLRTIQTLDAGARHAASFVLCDQIGLV